MNSKESVSLSVPFPLIGKVNLMKYKTICESCHQSLQPQTGLSFVCPKNCNSLQKNIYTSEKITFQNLPGIWRFLDWLPVNKTTSYDGKSVTYKSEKLAKELGLKNLYVTFTGYWPEIGARVKTCTFKELEAAVGIQYAKEHGVSHLIVASVGSVANAFAYLGSLEKFNVVLVVPSKVVDCLCPPLVEEKFVKAIAVEGEYWDAISTAQKLTGLTGFAYDAGGKSPARRDGLGTVMLEAVEKMKIIPNHYFQAVSSAAGAIAAFDEVERLAKDGRFGKPNFKLHLSQNDPFIPIVKAWTAKRRTIEKTDTEPENPLDIIYAKVLSNKNPLYGMKGGVFDALQATSGETYAVTNRQAQDASKMFNQLEGIDIHPAAAVAVASLINSVCEGKVSSEENILLNITGGGLKRAEKELGRQKISITAIVEKDASFEKLRDILL